LSQSVKTIQILLFEKSCFFMLLFIKHTMLHLLIFKFHVVPIRFRISNSYFFSHTIWNGNSISFTKVPKLYICKQFLHCFLRSGLLSFGVQSLSRTISPFSHQLNRSSVISTTSGPNSFHSQGDPPQTSLAVGSHSEEANYNQIYLI
jgi:hypothetical protein